MIAWVASALGPAACDREPEPPPQRGKQVFHLNPYEKDFGYSQAVLIDKTLYISGSVAADSKGRLVAPGDMAGQVRAAYSNIRRTLAAHGADFDEVVKEKKLVTRDLDTQALSGKNAKVTLSVTAPSADGCIFGVDGSPVR